MRSFGAGRGRPNSRSDNSRMRIISPGQKAGTSEFPRHARRSACELKAATACFFNAAAYGASRTALNTDSQIQAA
eukprot:13750291-Alexandrium_andersonii.AAC.1